MLNYQRVSHFITWMVKNPSEYEPKRKTAIIVKCG